MTRPLSTIAYEVRQLWKAPYYGAVPYLTALCALDDIKDAYGADSAKSIVAYFLANAQTWRGADARRIKKELNSLLKG